MSKMHLKMRTVAVLALLAVALLASQVQGVEFTCPEMSTDAGGVCTDTPDVWVESSVDSLNQGVAPCPSGFETASEAQCAAIHARYPILVRAGLGIRLGWRGYYTLRGVLGYLGGSFRMHRQGCSWDAASGMLNYAEPGTVAGANCHATYPDTCGLNGAPASTGNPARGTGLFPGPDCVQGCTCPSATGIPADYSFAKDGDCQKHNAFGRGLCVKIVTKKTTCPPGQYFAAGDDNHTTSDDTTCTDCGSGEFKAGTTNATSCSTKRTTCPPAQDFSAGNNTHMTSDDTGCTAKPKTTATATTTMVTNATDAPGATSTAATTMDTNATTAPAATGTAVSSP